MSILDVTKGQEQVLELAWCPNPRFNIVKTNSGIKFKPEMIQILQDSHDFLVNRKNTENLILALQKAIDLGWVA